MHPLAPLTYCLTSALLLMAPVSNAAEDYTFISGRDVYTALSQESFLVQGYVLGVADALKHNDASNQCFTIPLRPDADEALYSAYLTYWRNKEPLESGTESIIRALHSHFPC